jgi:hypothetical protein
VAGEGAVGDDEPGIARQRPFRADLRPVRGAPFHRGDGVGGVCAGHARHALRGRGGAGLCKIGLELREKRGVRRGHLLVVDGERVGGGVVLGGEEDGLGRDGDAAGGERRAHGAVVQHGCHDAGVRPAAIAAAGAAVEAGGEGVVGRRAAMAAEDDDRRETLRQPHDAQRAFGEEGLLGGAEAGRGLGPVIAGQRDAVRGGRRRRDAIGQAREGAAGRGGRHGAGHHGGAEGGARRLDEAEGAGHALLQRAQPGLGALQAGEAGAPRLGRRFSAGRRDLGMTCFGVSSTGQEA